MNQQATIVALQEKEIPHMIATSTMIDHTLTQQVLARAIKDASFRQALMRDPKRALTREFDVVLDDAVTLRVVEDVPNPSTVKDIPNTFTLFLPPLEVSFQDLTDADLEKAARAFECPTKSACAPTDVPTDDPDTWITMGSCDGSCG
jgi:hypothetical protein